MLKMDSQSSSKGHEKELKRRRILKKLDLSMKVCGFFVKEENFKKLVILINCTFWNIIYFRCYMKG